MKFFKLKKEILNLIERDSPAYLTYHGVHHTMLVIETCNLYVQKMNINNDDALLLKTAALFHDIGIPYDYFNHEEKGEEIARELLPEWGYTSPQIDSICGMIKSTKIPQSPKNLLEEILCDSDLDYLGTDMFYEISESLYQELLFFNIVSNVKEWDKLQVKFLKAHNYHTYFAKKYREPVKRKFLLEIKKKWGWNGLIKLKGDNK